MKEKIKGIQTPWKNYKEAPPLFTLLLFGGFIVLTVIAAILFGITVSAIIILLFSGFFAGYLAEAFTASFEIATFAKSVALILGFIGIIMLFISMGWWGIVGIFGWFILIALSRAHWQNRLKNEYGLGPW